MMERIHPKFKFTFAMLLLLITLYVINTLSKIDLLAYGGSMLHGNKNNLSLDKGVPFVASDHGNQPGIIGLWDVYFYDFRSASYGESQLVGQLVLQDSAYQFEYTGSIDGEIQNLLRDSFFIFRHSQGTFECSSEVNEIAPKYLLEGRQVIGDCSFMGGDGIKRRMFIQIETWQEKKHLVLVEPVELSRYPLWKIFKSIE